MRAITVAICALLATAHADDADELSARGEALAQQGEWQHAIVSNTETSPSISATGRTLMFQTLFGTITHTHIGVSTTDGTGWTTPTLVPAVRATETGFDGDPDLARDGRTLLFDSSRFGTSATTIYIVDMLGGCAPP